MEDFKKLPVFPLYQGVRDFGSKLGAAAEERLDQSPADVLLVPILRIYRDKVYDGGNLSRVELPFSQSSHDEADNPVVRVGHQKDQLLIRI
jgi:hypothetical protein